MNVKEVQNKLLQILVGVGSLVVEYCRAYPGIGVGFFDGSVHQLVYLSAGSEGGEKQVSFIGVAGRCAVALNLQRRIWVIGELVDSLLECSATCCLLHSIEGR